MTGDISSHPNKGLQIEEPLLSELGSPDMCGVDFPTPPPHRDRLGDLRRDTPIGLPGLSEPRIIRHFTRLSQKNYGIDSGFYLLGSCTMKHNPRLNEKLARLSGFAGLHPLQPVSTAQGALQLFDTLADWLKTLTGMPAIAMSPAAGAHGELCGTMMIRAALEARGDARKVVLVPDSAHGTNPATASMCGYSVEAIPSDGRGRVDLAALKTRLGDDVAAFMLTNPSTCGLFEDEILEQAQSIHDAGALFYCDGANFNALVGRVRPGDLGIDCMHLNLHKTFSTPHGGGGPGSGPLVMAEELAPFAPPPWIVHGAEGLDLVDGGEMAARSIGRLKAFHGQFGVFVRALAFCLSHGRDGLKQLSEDAVLSANYLLARLSAFMTAPYPGPCMHEVLFDDGFLKGSGVTTLDIAKRLLDLGIHPMTIYFPLHVSGALLIEPTESETLESLDQFVEAMRQLTGEAASGDAAKFHEAPIQAPRRRFDETNAARYPVLRWRPAD